MRGEILKPIEYEKPQNFRELPNDSGRKEYICELPDDSGDFSIEKKDTSVSKFGDVLFDSEKLENESNPNLKEKDDVIGDKKYGDVDDSYYSTYDERLKQIPKEGTERGEWDGERGESKFVPTDGKIKDILDEYDMNGVTYEDGIPDFSDCSEATVQIDDMTENRYKNFRQCDEKCAEQWNKDGKEGKTDWTPRDVANWRAENGYTWHERNDMKTCDLVPTEINDYFGHLGGVSECRKRDSINDGGNFDE